MDFLFEEMDNADNAQKTLETVARPGNSSNQSVPSNDMGAMRGRFESMPKQSQTQSNTIGSMEADWNVPESQRTPILYDTISEAKSLDNARLRLAQDYAGEMAELRGKHNWSGGKRLCRFFFLKRQKTVARTMCGRYNTSENTRKRRKLPCE